MSNFKTRVLDYSIKEINEHTDLTATYTQKKQGRTIVGFKFEFKQKTKAKPSSEPTKDLKTVDLFDGLTDLERQAIQERINDHIQRLEANGELVSDFHRKNIMKKAIAERWGLDMIEKKRQKKQKVDSQKAMEQVWQAIPNGTRFCHKQDGSIWLKEHGYLKTLDNRAVPEGQTTYIFQQLEIISEEH